MKARRPIMWTAAGICLLLIGLWVCSIRWWVQCYHIRGQVQRNISSMRGALWIGPSASGVPDPSGFRFHGARFTPADGQPTYWWFHANRAGYTIIPYWLLLVVPAATAWMSRRDSRRFGPGKCTSCGYDLAGLLSACPECGRAIPPQ